MSHPVVHFQIVTNAPDDHARFYTKLFDWTVDASNAVGYRRFQMGTDRGIPGGVWPAPPQANPFVQLFIEVEDAAAHASKASVLGARVLIPPQTLPDGETMAVLLDPQGVPFVLVQPAPGAGGAPVT